MQLHQTTASSDNGRTVLTSRWVQGQFEPAQVAAGPTQAAATKEYYQRVTTIHQHSSSYRAGGALACGGGQRPQLRPLRPHLWRWAGWSLSTLYITLLHTTLGKEAALALSGVWAIPGAALHRAWPPARGEGPPSCLCHRMVQRHRRACPQGWQLRQMRDTICKRSDLRWAGSPADRRSAGSASCGVVGGRAYGVHLVVRTGSPVGPLLPWRSAAADF